MSLQLAIELLTEIRKQRERCTLCNEVWLRGFPSLYPRKNVDESTRSLYYDRTPYFSRILSNHILTKKQSSVPFLMEEEGIYNLFKLVTNYHHGEIRSLQLPCLSLKKNSLDNSWIWIWSKIQIGILINYMMNLWCYFGLHLS